MSSEFLLIGGEAGGKTTFAAGFLYYLERESDLSRPEDYEIQFLYNKNVITNKVMDQMWHPPHEYPPKTEEPYMLRLYFYEGSLFPKEVTFDIMDIPGEKQYPDAVDGSFRELLKGVSPFHRSARQELVEEYRTTLKPKLEGGEDLTRDEWAQVFRFRYARSDTAIVMLNLHKLMNVTTMDPEIVEGPEDLLSVAAGKRRKLVLATACDVVGYDPEDFDGGQRSLLSGTVRDVDLANEISKSIEIGDVAVSRMLRQVTANDSDFSFLGVSVPAEDPTVGENVRTDSRGNLDPRGFEEVLRWLTG